MAEATHIMVVGFMPVEQFEPDEIDTVRRSGLMRQLEFDLTEELGENLDDIIMLTVTEPEKIRNILLSVWDETSATNE